MPLYTEEEAGVKRCSRCKTGKRPGDFDRCRSNPDGRYIWCKACRKEHRDARKPQIQFYNRKQNLRRFGLTIDEYNAMMTAQGGLCAICEGSPGRRRLDVDHCHDTGLVRGLLCENCNKAIGLFDDSPDLLQAAIDYLRKTGQ